SGCGDKSSTNHVDSMAMEPIQVGLQVNPTEIQVGEKVHFEAKVTYQGKTVDDAKEVMFEIWKDGDSEDQHSKVTVKSAGEGSYVFEKTFKEAGNYHVTSHVTARDQHSMPSEEFTVHE
ncbi:MAG TPA: FixH family protein, partial [Paenibacillus sp.]